MRYLKICLIIFFLVPSLSYSDLLFPKGPSTTGGMPLGEEIDAANKFVCYIKYASRIASDNRNENVTVRKVFSTDPCGQGAFVTYKVSNYNSDFSGYESIKIWISESAGETTLKLYMEYTQSLSDFYELRISDFDWDVPKVERPYISVYKGTEGVRKRYVLWTDEDETDGGWTTGDKLINAVFIEPFKVENNKWVRVAGSENKGGIKYEGTSETNKVYLWNSDHLEVNSSCKTLGPSYSSSDELYSLINTTTNLPEGMPLEFVKNAQTYNYMGQNSYLPEPLDANSELTINGTVYTVEVTGKRINSSTSFTSVASSNCDVFKTEVPTESDYYQRDDLAEIKVVDTNVNHSSSHPTPTVQ